MEVRLTAKVGDRDVGLGFMILDMSKLLQAIQERTMTTPSSVNGPVSHLISPSNTNVEPTSVDSISYNMCVREMSQGHRESPIQIIAASSLPSIESPCSRSPAVTMSTSSTCGFKTKCGSTSQESPCDGESHLTPIGVSVHKSGNEDDVSADTINICREEPQKMTTIINRELTPFSEDDKSEIPAKSISDTLNIIV